MKNRFSMNKEYKKYWVLSANKGPKFEYAALEQNIIERYDGLSQTDKINFKHYLENSKRTAQTCLTTIHDIFVPFSIAFVTLLIAILTLIPAIMQPMRALLLDTMIYSDEMDINNSEAELLENIDDEADRATIIRNRESLNFRNRIETMSNYINKDAEDYLKVGKIIFYVLLLFWILYTCGVFALRKRESFYEDCLEIIDKANDRPLVSGSEDSKEELLLSEYRKLSPSLKSSVCDIVANLKK